MEERLKAMEGQGVLGMDANDFGLVSGVKVPPKFKPPVFEKYNGSSCPITHATAYFQKMSVHTKDQGLLVHFFQDSLSGASLEWYMKLEKTHICCWNDLSWDFVKHYQYNVDMAPNHTQLQNLSQGPKESLKEYAQKWRELVARVQPPLMERELVNMFMITLQGPFYHHKIGNASAGFTDLVMAGERIEAGLKLGKIKISGSSGSLGDGKKPFNSYPKKREGDTSAVYSHRGIGEDRQHQQINVAYIPVNAPPQQRHNLVP